MDELELCQSYEEREIEEGVSWLLSLLRVNELAGVACLALACEACDSDVWQPLAAFTCAAARASRIPAGDPAFNLHQP